MPKEIFQNPGKELARAKKEKKLGKSVGVLAFSWILMAATVWISASLASGLAGVPLLSSLGVFVSASGTAMAAAAATFVIGLIGSLFLAYPLQVVLNAMGGKGQYFQALTPIAYSLFVASVGLLVAAILSFIPMGIGALLGFVVLAVTLPLSVVVLLRGVKDLWGMDWLGSVIGVGIYALGVGAAISIAALSASLSALPALV